MNPTEEWDGKEGKAEEDAVPKAGRHLLVVEVGKTTSGVAMQDDSLPNCVLNHSQQGVKHVVEHLLNSSDLLKNGCFVWLLSIKTTQHHNCSLGCF